MSELVRLYKYPSLLSSRQARSAAELMAAQEVSRATLKRDLAKLRDQLNVPIRFDRDRGGYVLDAAADTLELPGVRLTLQDWQALAAGLELLIQFEPALLVGPWQSLPDRLAALLARQGLDRQPLAGRVRVSPRTRTRVDTPVLQTVLQATLAQQRLRLGWRAAYTRPQDEVSPQRLLRDRERWLLQAWCHRCEALVTLPLDGLESAKPLALAARLLPPEQLDAGQMGAAMPDPAAGKALPQRWARLRVAGRAGRPAELPLWDPRQRVHARADGAWEVAIPYVDDTDIVGDILRWGPQVQVLAPGALRQRVQRTLLESVSRYVDAA